jgi:hypothetical protein
VSFDCYFGTLPPSCEAKMATHKERMALKSKEEAEKARRYAIMLFHPSVRTRAPRSPITTPPRTRADAFLPPTDRAQ